MRSGASHNSPENDSEGIKFKNKRNGDLVIVSGGNDRLQRHENATNTVQPAREAGPSVTQQCHLGAKRYGGDDWDGTSVKSSILNPKSESAVGNETSEIFVKRFEICPRN